MIASIPCPCCKASNDTGPNCRRCKADLGLLFQLEGERARHLSAARSHLAQDAFADALTRLDAAAQLRPGDDIAQLRAIQQLLARNFTAAFATHKRLRRDAS